MNKDAVIEILKRYPVAIISTIFALICLLVIFFRGDISSDLEGVESDLNRSITTLNTNAKNAPALAEEVELIEALVEKIDIHLFDREQRAVNTNFFYTLEELLPIRLNGVNQTGAQVPNIQVKGKNALKLYGYLTYDIAIQGSYDDVVRLLKEISSFNAFIRVVGVQMAGSRAANKQNQIARIRIAVLAKD